MTPGDLLLPIGLSLAGLGAGLAWRIPSVARRDARLMLRINNGNWPGVVDRLLGFLRIAGTTPFFVFAIVLVAFLRPDKAPGLVLAAVVAEGIAKGLKLALRRPRPYTADGSVIVRLARLPTDPSFPSADTMRAAFLAGMTAATGTGAWWQIGMAAFLAAAVGLGRVRSGAHYALDVLTGWALGLGAVLAWTRTL